MKRTFGPLIMAMVATLVVLAACFPAVTTPVPVVRQVAAESTVEPGAGTDVPAPTAVHLAIGPSDATPGGPIIVSYWDQESSDVDVFLDDLARRFMSAHAGIKIERAHLGSEELRGGFESAAAAGMAPALTRAPNYDVGSYSQLGIIQPVDGLFDRSFFDQFYSASLEPTQIGGKQWGVPDNYGNHLMLLYNKKLLSEPVPADTNAWVAQLKKLTDPSNQRYGLVYNLNEPFWLMPWLGAYGGWPLNGQDQPDLDNAAMIDALQFVHDLKFSAKVVPQGANYDAADTMFKQGQAVYLINGDWSLDGYRQAGVDFGVAALPKLTATGEYPSVMTAGKYWYFTQGLSGPRLEAARQLSLHMTSKEVQLEWLDKWGRLPSNVQASGGEKITSDPILKGSMEALSHGKGMPAAAQLDCTWDAMRPGLEAVMSDSTTPANAAKKMQEEAMRCVSEMGITKSGG